MPPASGWPRWSQQTGQKDHWLAAPFGPSGPTQRDFQPAVWMVGRYDTAEVDAFRDAVRDTFLGVGRSSLTWRAPPGKQFTTTRRLRPGYDPEQVDAFLNKAERKLAAMESTDRPEEPLVSGTILTDEPSGPTQQDFQPPAMGRVGRMGRLNKIFNPQGVGLRDGGGRRVPARDSRHVPRGPATPLTWDEVCDKRFRMARRGGYDVVQVDAFCDEAEQRLAAMRPIYMGRRG